MHVRKQIHMSVIITHAVAAKFIIIVWNFEILIKENHFDKVKMGESSHLDLFLFSHSFNNKKQKVTSINQPHEEEIYMLHSNQWRNWQSTLQSKFCLILIPHHYVLLFTLNQRKYFYEYYNC